MTTYRSQIRAIAYDTPSDRRRRKFAKLLKGYGLRVQWSVLSVNCVATNCNSCVSDSND
jgi:CRISPR-associated endonuclease Cas2